jgi:glycyl-tRNA synthetase beta chain
VTGRGELFVELRAEELAPGSIRGALASLEAGLIALIQGVEHGAVRAWATPRRLAVAIADVAPARPVVERVVTGPPAERAFDAAGAPTQAGIGFARGKGVAPSALTVVDGPKGKVVAVTVQEGGERVVELVSAGLEALILGLPFAKSMEWGDGGIRFGRPIHGVVALYAGEVVPGSVAGVVFGDTTRGHRLAPDRDCRVASADDWLAAMRARGVEPDLAAREARIRALLSEGAQRCGGDLVDDDALVERVLHLTEAPTLVCGAFEQDLLALPEKLLVQSMRAHTETFPVRVDGKLTPRFLAISNNPWGDEQLIASGYARVLRARFHDARFFLAEDKKRTLDQHGERLARMQWIRGLGTVADKAARLVRLAPMIAEVTGADPEATARAASLCKSDLATQMVGEFPELQGHMGRLYASHQGERAEVAAAIEEHYAPAGGDGALPASAAGLALALADRFDTLAGCFAVGIVPTGGGDPQGLRRAAAGIVRMAVDRGLDLDLGRWAQVALDGIARQAGGAGFEAWRAAAEPASEATCQRIVEFVLQRQRATAGVSPDIVDAVVSVSPPEPHVIARRVVALAALTQADGFEPLLVTVKRASNITRTLGAPEGPRAELADPAELALLHAVASAERSIAERPSADVDGALAVLAALGPPVAAFFDAVLVDAPDPAVKAARLDLLGRVVSLFRGIADFTRISSR